MEAEDLKYVGIGLVALGTLGFAIGTGIIAAMLHSTARNPDAGPKFAKYVYVGAGLTEAMGVFAMVSGLLIIFG